MSPTTKTLGLSETLYKYVLNNSLREPNIVRELREETARLPRSVMLTPPEEAHFIVWLLQLMNARRMLETGTFTGYTTLWSALTLPDDGCIISCDVNEQDQGSDVCATRELNAKLHHDERITLSMQTLSDGLTLAIRK